MATSWQMADDAPEIQTGEMPAELRLVAAVFRRVITDLRSTDVGHRRDAVAFFRGHRGSLQAWCEILGVEVAVIQRLAGFPLAEPNPKNPRTRGVDAFDFPAGGKI